MTTTTILYLTIPVAVFLLTLVLLFYSILRYHEVSQRVDNLQRCFDLEQQRRQLKMQQRHKEGNWQPQDINPNTTSETK